MNQFRRLMTVALVSGALAGLALFALRHAVVVPLIERAEIYEAEAAGTPAVAIAGSSDREHEHGAAALVHDEEGWQPAEGLERVGFTALTTVIGSIGFAALLVAVMALRGDPINTRSGLVWGLAGFACLSLAPAIGLPPAPPGAAEAALEFRQVWWIGTVIATAVGLMMLTGPRVAWRWLVGLLLLAAPHLIGAPSTQELGSAPADLLRDFAIVSVLCSAFFWVSVGALSGWFYHRWTPAETI